MNKNINVTVVNTNNVATLFRKYKGWHIVAVARDLRYKSHNILKTKDRVAFLATISLSLFVIDEQEFIREIYLPDEQKVLEFTNNFIKRIIRRNRQIKVKMLCIDNSNHITNNYFIYRNDC